MTIFYTLNDKLYINITNACPCACIFCIREGEDGVGDAQNLWLEREPTMDEITAAFDCCNLDGMTEIVFCGYGEPLERADTVVEACDFIKSKCSLPIRINTNGLVKLINPDFDIGRLRVADGVSVSLNADDELEYLRVTRPRFGICAYDAMLNFVREVRAYTDVSLTIVDILDEARVRRCSEIAEDLGLPLKIRQYS